MATTRPPKRFRFADDVVGEGLVNAPASTPIPQWPDHARMAYTKRATTDRFAEWRRGNYNWVEADRRPQIDAVVHPRPGAWDPWDLTDPAVDGLLDTIRANRRSFRQASRNQADDALPRAVRPVLAADVEQASAIVDEQFAPVRFRQVRPLGAGGHAAVFLLVTEDSNWKSHSVVAKLDPRRGSRGTREEIENLKVCHTIWATRAPLVCCMTRRDVFSNAHNLSA